MRHHRSGARALGPRGRAALAAVVAVGLCAVVAGCSAGGDAGDDSDAGAPGAGTTTAPAQAAPDADPGEANAADVMFVRMMIPHHEQAVVMSDDALRISEDPVIRGLAEDIRDAQQPEIDLMLGWLDEWDVPAMPGGGGMDHRDHDGMGGGMDGAMDGGMAGMMSEEELAALQEASGAEFDRMWADMMIEHHEGAIDMARDVQRRGQSPQVDALAAEIVESQQAEIDIMVAWRSPDGS